MKAKFLMSLVSIASLLLVQACNSSSGGGGGGVTPTPNGQSSEADITSLALTVSGAELSIDIDFDANREATVDYPYSTTALTSVIVQAITISADATSDHSTGATINVENDKIIITVTARDDTTSQTYTINFVQAQPNTEADIASLTVNVSGVGHTISFDANRQATVNYPYSTTALTNVIVQAITISADAASDHGTGATINVENGKITITVTAQDGTTSQTYTINLVQAQPNTGADIASLTVNISGVGHTISFDANRQATVNYPYSTTALTNVIVQAITISADATSDYDAGAILTLSDDKVTITVTAQDGTTSQTYTINLVMAANSEADITSLVLTVLGADQTIDFGDKAEVTEYYPYSGSDLLSVIIKSISLSAGATSDYDGGETINVTDGKATITVTAQDGTTSQTYTINLVASTNTEADITSLIVTVSGADQTIDFGDKTEDTAYYPYGSSDLLSVIIKSISLSAGATSDYGAGATIDVANDQVTITVTAQYGSTVQTYNITFVQTLPTLRGILDSTIGGTSRVPHNLSEYDELSQTVLAHYNAGANLRARYVTIDGGAEPQGGLSWSDAAPADELEVALAVAFASSDNGFLVLVASSAPGTSYKTRAPISMDNYVAIIGGWDANGGWGRSVYRTVLSGENSRRVFKNDPGMFGHIRPTAQLYALTIKNGNSGEGNGGGMYNVRSSPTLTDIVFDGNYSLRFGGGMYNSYSSPILTNVTFFGNEGRFGGGMSNDNSSPILTNVTFSGNEATTGGGISNNYSASILTNVTFFGNEATDKGGGMFSSGSPLRMTNITFSGNSSTVEGGGLFIGSGQGTTIVNSIFWGNTANSSGAQIHINGAIGDPITLAYSVIAGGAPANADITTDLETSTNPSLSALAIKASLVPIMSIDSDSSAKDVGVYVRRNGDNFYYSTDNDNWYSGFDSSGLTDSTSDASAEAEGSIDVTATDATGTARSGRPDAGAYEARQ